MRWCWLFGVVWVGCASDPLTEACPSFTLERSLSVDLADRVDLLFVLDGSSSMAEERAALRSELPRVLRILSTGDRDEDGVLDFEPLGSLHVGVATSDLGGGGGPGCDGDGDGAALLDEAARLDCDARYPSRVFSFGGDPARDPLEVAREVGCVGDLSDVRCGIEQPLEAMLRALSPSVASVLVAPDYVPPTFERGVGLGDGVNAGFLRPDTALSVVIVTDEDDCSHRGELFGASEDVPRCDAEVFPLERYRDGLLQLRRRRASLLVTVIAGAPPDLAGAPYESLLADPRLAPGVVSCASDLGHATSPRRLIELSSMLRDEGVRTQVASICEGWDAIVDGLVPAVAAARATALCLPRALAVDGDGQVSCAVEIVLPASSERPLRTRCESLGLEYVTTDLDGFDRPRERCVLPQLGGAWSTSAALGWGYDDTRARFTCATPQGLGFSGLEGWSGFELHVRCEQPLPLGAPACE